MTYKVKGYVFNKENEPCEILEGITADNYEEARELFKMNGIENYLFILKENEEEE